MQYQTQINQLKQDLENVQTTKEEKSTTICRITATEADSLKQDIESVENEKYYASKIDNNNAGKIS